MLKGNIYKVIVVNFIIITTFAFFVGCSSAWYFNETKIHHSEIVKIEIVNVNSFDNKEQNYDVIADFAEDEKDELLSELAKIKFTYSYGPPNTSPDGYCLKLFYANNEVRYLNSNTYIRCSATDEILGTMGGNIGCDQSRFKEFILSFIKIS